KQGVSESSTSSQQDQDYKDRIQDENDATEKSHEDSSLKDNDTANQQVNNVCPEVNTGSRDVNTASPEVNTGSRDVSNAVPEVITTTPEDLVGPSHASDVTQVEDQEIDLGNIPQSYAVPTTPNTRIHKDHPIDHVIGYSLELVAYTDSDYAELHKIRKDVTPEVSVDSTICIIENPVQYSKTKHIEIRHHFIRDYNAKKLIQMAKIDTEHNVADLLTKGLDAGRLPVLSSSIGMLNP
ncbi:hypothetical protein Tco_0645040, partial [Tanacetum coccineum]